MSSEVISWYKNCRSVPPWVGLATCDRDRLDDIFG